MNVRLLVAILAVVGLVFTLFKTNFSAKTGTFISEQSIPILFGALEKSDRPKAKNNSQDLMKSPEETQDDIQNVENKNISVAIANIETDLKNRNAIQRLNTDNLASQERVQIGQDLQYLARLRAQDLEQQLKDIENLMAELSAIHSSRLQAFGVAP